MEKLTGREHAHGNLVLEVRGWLEVDVRGKV
jgi:hypothetical protein